MIRVPIMRQLPPNLRIRPAVPADGERVAAMCAGLSAAEGQGIACRFTAAAFRNDGFGPAPAFCCLIAEVDGEPMGYALFCPDYDTDRLCRSLYLVDLYVESAARRQGIGHALMAAAARTGRERGARVMMWSVLRSNAPARRFYSTVGEEIDDQVTMGVTGEAFGRLATMAPPRDGLTLRTGTPDDCRQVDAFLSALLTDIGLPQRTGAAAQFRADGFGADPAFTILVAERASEALGYALFWPTYDTESASRGGWLSDLYVRPAARRQGVALQLMAEIARRTAACGGCYLVWLLHRSNARALGFYRRFAEEWSEGIPCLCDEARFAALAAKATP
jgi:GNAT superfamily N-acetyltransferase